MTESTPPPAKGQIEAPNPVELFWEKNKRWVVAGAVIAAIALGVNYAAKYTERRASDRLWSGFSAAVSFDHAYAEDGTFIGFLDNARQQQPGDQQLGRLLQMADFYLQVTRGELVTELREDLLAADPERLAQEKQAAAGTPAEPLLLWLAAVRHVETRAWQEATALLDELERDFPEHFLCLRTEYPAQYRAPLEKKKKDEVEDTRRRRREKPKLAEPVEGSLVSRLRDRIAREQEFRANHAALYEAPPPDPSPEVVIRFAPIDEEIRIRFYRGQARAQVDQFLRLVQQGFYTGQRIDEVRRTPRASAQPVPEQLHFGLPASKENDRVKWTEARAKDSGVQLDFADNDLSHFPGMMAAAPEGDGKSSGERLWINATDAATLDGERVIFGRVVEGLQVLEQIVRMPLADDEMNQRGRGQLQQNITLESVTIEGELPADFEAGDGKKEEDGEETTKKEEGQAPVKEEGKD